MSARRSAKRRPSPPSAKPAGSPAASAPDAPAAPAPAPPDPPAAPAPPPKRRRATALAVAALAGAAGLALVIVLALRGRSASPSAPPQQPPQPQAARAAADAAVAIAGAKPPAARPPNPFVGSARCADCHEKEHARWKDSWHARALSPGKRPYVVGDFKNAHFTGSSSEAWMKRDGERYVMRARDVAGAFADFPVNWVIGGKRMQDDVTVFPDGRWQVLPVYFHVTGKGEWVDYTEAKQGALTPEHPFYWTNVRRMANHECLDCHTTGLRVTYDEPAHKWQTSFIDPNVACEDCHGPGGRHAETSEERDIVHPVRSGAAGMSACARCHGPRKPLFPMLDPDHQFELGQPYDEFYEPIVVVQGTGTSPEFFADGKPRTSSFEYQAMIQSACYRKGGATCLTCHTAPHDEAREHAELRAKDPDASCRKCHAEVAAAGRAHTHHAAPAAQRCIACHMAPIVSGVLDHFADHSIDVPVPANTEKHGVPSACGVCHADKPAAALATSLATWWPDAAKRQARRLRLADAFDPATARQSARPLVQVLTDAAEAPTLRAAAAMLVAIRFGPQTAPALAPLLDSPDVILRAKGCEALGAAHATAAADLLVRRLDDPSLRVRLAAALALFDLGDPRAEAALHRLAETPASSHLMMPHLELGHLLANRRDLAAARAEMTQVVRLAPYYTDGLVELAAMSAADGDLAEAHARIDQALQLEPHNARALALRAKLDEQPKPK